MTYVWTALIVIGAAMILFALWPSIRGRAKEKQAESAPGDGEH